MSESRMWILGADDPEISVIETLLRECGEQVAYATIDGQRVHPGNAYRADALSGDFLGLGVYYVECHVSSECAGIHIDHHRPGDPGYGLPPAEFLRASSIGQVIDALCQLDALPVSWKREQYSGHYCDSFAIHDFGTAQQRYVVVRSVGDTTVIAVPHDIVLTAAADHCVDAAYRAECPGVDPDELMSWRAETFRPLPGVIRSTRDARNPTRRGCRRAIATARRAGTYHDPWWRDPDPCRQTGDSMSHKNLALYQARQAAAILRLCAAAEVAGYCDFQEWVISRGSPRASTGRG
jgi:hypothetical protein